MKPVIQRAVRDLIEDNLIFFEQKASQHFEGFYNLQNPRSTTLLCSDSRVQTDNFSQGAENDLFVVRNIGNQFSTNEGSVEYGVNVLKTPVLLIVGHSNCGAVKAAMEHNPSVPPAIQRELDFLQVKEASNEKEGVLLNVNNQVHKALASFKDRVNSGELAIIGAIYDFRNDYGFGKGRLIIVNLNGKKDPQEIHNSHYFDGMENVAIGLEKQGLNNNK